MLKGAICIVLFSVACETHLSPSRPSQILPRPIVSQSPERRPVLSNLKMTCDQVREIKTFPFKGEEGIDAAYDSLRKAGDSAVPCLIDSITDTTPMADPRQTPKFSDVRVGDVAYFVLLDITKIDFVEFLPAKVKEAYKQEGVYAYFRFVEKPANRKKLQDNLRVWYQEHHKAEG